MNKQEYAQKLEARAIDQINIWLSKQDQDSLLEKPRMDSIVFPRIFLFICNIENDFREEENVMISHCLYEDIPTLGIPEIDGTVIGHATINRTIHRMQDELKRMKYKLSEDGNNDVVGITAVMETIMNNLGGDEMFARALTSLANWNQDGYLTEMADNASPKDGLMMLTIASDRVIRQAGWIKHEGIVNMYEFERSEAPVHVKHGASSVGETLINTRRLEKFINAALSPISQTRE